jgi:alanyl-tRNA synthetase
VPADRLPERVAALQSEVKEIKRAQKKHKSEQAKSAEIPLIRIGDATACIAWIEGADANQLRATVDDLRAKHNDRKFVTVLGSGSNGKATLIIGATADLEGTPLEAGKLIDLIAPLFGGRGGGKARLAQAGGSDAARLKALLQSDAVSSRIRELIRS